MTKLTATRLAEQLLDAADLLRGRAGINAYTSVISAMLVLKRVSDQPGILRVPDLAHWSSISHLASAASPWPTLSEVLLDLQRSNPGVLDGVMENLDIPRGLGAADLKALTGYFERISLSDEDLEFSDDVGRAYDHFIGRCAEMAGKQGGEFYTPRSLVDLMVRLVRPQPGQSVYDPFAGSADMLVRASEYVREHGSKQADVSLHGQELNHSTWAVARLNLLLHNTAGRSLLLGDALTDPLHITSDSGRVLFDLALTHPPFSMNYDKAEVTVPERMQYGWASEHGKADLMCVQHVLAMLRPDGIGAVLTPMGVLFRSGAEAEIRRGIIEDGRLMAVISLGPNLLHGTSIPACILVLCGTERRQREVLFINAERELVKGRPQNRLDPEHVEKIVGVFRDWVGIPGFSRAVVADEIASNGFNLNVRRYIDRELPARLPLDAHAVLSGGVPAREIEAEAGRFQAFGIDIADLFCPKAPGYVDFLPGGPDAAMMSIADLAAPSEQEFASRCRAWWETTQSDLAGRASRKQLLTSRTPLLVSFRAALLPAGLLDKYQLSGVFATWWSYWHTDIRTLEASGFSAVADRWVTADGGQHSRITQDTARGRVLARLGTDLCSRAQDLVATQRQVLTSTYLSWIDRYAASLSQLEAQRDAASARLTRRLKELGYLD